MDYKEEFKPIFKTDSQKRTNNINENIDGILKNLVDHRK